MTTFFKWLWRFNALGIAILLFIGGIIGSWAIYHILTHERHVYNVIKTHESPDSKDSYKLGTLQTWANSKYGIVPLYLSQHLEETYYSKSSESNIVNYLFVHLKDGKSHWLFPHSRFLILKMIPLSASPKTSFSKKSSSLKEYPEAILYELVQDCDQKRQKLSAKDPKTLALSFPDGSNYVELFSNITALYDAHITDHGDILVVFENQEGFYTAMIQKDNFTIKHQALIPDYK